jgi:proteic killer suppression protein
VIKSFRSSALKRYWTKGQQGAIQPKWRDRVRAILSRLEVATAPQHMDLPGLGFHRLTGNLAGRYAVTVTRNWRITFAWEGADAIDVDMEDYHGC